MEGKLSHPVFIKQIINNLNFAFDLPFEQFKHILNAITNQLSFIVVPIMAR